MDTPYVDCKSNRRVALFLGVGLMIAILFRRYLRYFGKLKREKKREEKKAKSSKTPCPREPAGLAKQSLVDAPDNVLRWQVEMHDTARDLKAELDSKIGVLQSLVKMADDRIAQLTSLVERTRAAAHPGDGIEAARQLVDEMRTTVSQATDLQKDGLTTAGSRVESTGFGMPGNNDMRQSIYQLADRGLDASQISEKTGRSLGDVEFILALRTAE